MTRALTLEWGRYGVRVNALAHGFILTDIIRKLWTDLGMREWGQLGELSDLVGAVLFGQVQPLRL